MNRRFPGPPPAWAVLPLALGLFLPLAGCGLFSDPPPPPAYQPGPVEAYLAPADRVTLDDSFTSAKGESCKRATVLAGQREAEVVVICRNAEGQWRMAPRVWGQGIDTP